MAMNGNDEATYDALASEVQQIQLSPRKSPPPPDNEEKAIHLRFLLSNAEAGSIIGKGGATINDIQSQSGARIQLSRNFEYFPGTSDRIIMVSGTVDEVLKGVDIILSKLLDEFYVEDGGEIDTGSKLKLVVPNSSCGGIIGKGGAIIRSLIEDSGAGIKITSQDMGYPGLHDRLVIVSGTLSEQMRAVELILLNLVDDQYYQQSPNVPFPYTALVYNGMNYGPNGAAGNYPNNNRFPNKEERSISETIGIADEHIGLVVGRGGRNIMEISQISGAKIKISDRGDFIAGTSERKVTITGSERAIRAAESMISRKLAFVTESQS